MTYSRLYVALTATVYTAMTVVFVFFPRSSYSKLENRDLSHFPKLTLSGLGDGSFFSDVSAWFSDTEPYRDRLMTLSMKIKDRTRLVLDDDNVTFHPAEETEEKAEETPAEEKKGGMEFKEYENKVTADENAKIAHAGIIIVGKGENVRALMCYGGTGGGTKFANTVNEYKKVFGKDVDVYCMVIPSSSEFYMPAKMKNRSKSQLATIKNIYENLTPDVKPVNVYNALGDHLDEAIFLRTDHHWAPLGGFYAAREFAKVAKVPFEELSSYDEHVVHRYVGSMYGFSKDISIKEAPEDFIYYVPRDVEYSVHYVTYKTNKSYQITGILSEENGPFFYKYRDGAAGAYCTFMGGDQRLTRVSTTTPNGRRVLIIKDSFGNTIPGYLFYSFEEVHVVDNRYFHLNMKDYVREHGITDILFACNVFNAYSSGSISKNSLKYLTQDPANAFSKDGGGSSKGSKKEGKKAEKSKETAEEEQKSKEE